MLRRFYLDPLLLIIALLMLATLAAFFSRLTPYPYGILVLTIFFIARLLSIRNRRAD
jgi:hypothetical protein